MCIRDSNTLMKSLTDVNLTNIVKVLKNNNLAAILPYIKPKPVCFALVIQDDLQKPIVYCSLILIGIIYSNLNTILKLK